MGTERGIRSSETCANAATSTTGRAKWKSTTPSQIGQRRSRGYVSLGHEYSRWSPCTLFSRQSRGVIVKERLENNRSSLSSPPYSCYQPPLSANGTLMPTCDDVSPRDQANPPTITTDMIRWGPCLTIRHYTDTVVPLVQHMLLF